MTGTAPGRAAMSGAGGYRARFLLRLSLIVALGTVLLFATLFAVFSSPLSGDYEGVFFALRHLAAFLFPIIAFSFLVYTLLVCGATAVLCVYALHKVAGPLYRMERVAESYVSGNPVPRVVFRQGDQGAALAEAFNDFVARLRGDRHELAEAMERAEGAFPGDPPASRAEMERCLGEITTLLSRYR
ncbi:MAG: hypothetical protein HZA60_11205 [Deltaproteobacteria bacterium]|nr:hypothetical protein [Deltaproteobacteria bacterium]